MNYTERYLKVRLRDLGYAGLNARQQAVKVLQEYANGTRSIVSAYCDNHLVMLIERGIWRQKQKAEKQDRKKIRKKIGRRRRKWLKKEEGAVWSKIARLEEK